METYEIMDKDDLWGEFQGGYIVSENEIDDEDGFGTMMASFDSKEDAEEYCRIKNKRVVCVSVEELQNLFNENHHLLYNTEEGKKAHLNLFDFLMKYLSGDKNE